MNQKQIYLINQINTSSPLGLVVLLYDGLLRFAEEARQSLASEPSCANKQHAANSVNRCTAILTELSVTLKPEYNEELCSLLKNLYAFFTQELSKALREEQAGRINQILPLITDLRDAWSQIEAKVPVQS